MQLVWAAVRWLEWGCLSCWPTLTSCFPCLPTLHLGPSDEWFLVHLCAKQLNHFFSSLSFSSHFHWVSIIITSLPSVFTRNCTICCYSSSIMPASSECDEQGCMVHILISSYLWHCNLLLCSFLSFSYLFFSEDELRKKSLYHSSSYKYMHPCFLFHVFISVFTLDKNTSVLKFCISLSSIKQILLMKENLDFSM